MFCWNIRYFIHLNILKSYDSVRYYNIESKWVREKKETCFELI